jgi:hypothetical protein
MVRRRARSASITTQVCNHIFRGTGITAYLENGGTLEKARQMAAHGSTRTTQLYDRREARVTLDKIVKLVLGDKHPTHIAGFSVSTRGSLSIAYWPQLRSCARGVVLGRKVIAQHR